MTTPSCPPPARPRKSLRQHPAYNGLLFGLLLVVLGGMLYLVRSPEMGSLQALRTRLFESAPQHADTAPPSVVPTATDAGAAPARSALEATAGVANAPVAGTNPSAASATSANGTRAKNTAAEAVEALRQRIQGLNDGEGAKPGADTAPGAEPGSAENASGEAFSPGETDTLPERTEAGPRYSVDLPAYDREGMAARQRALEALRAQTLTDLRTVSPTDPEAMIAVIQRMGEGLRAQGLPNVIDMPKMEALLRGAQRMNVLNTALQAEMARSGGTGSDETRRLAAEMQAVQSTMPNTVYDLSTMGRLMRGESP